MLEDRFYGMDKYVECLGIQNAYGGRKEGYRNVIGYKFRLTDRCCDTKYIAKVYCDQPRTADEVLDYALARMRDKMEEFRLRLNKAPVSLDWDEGSEYVDRAGELKQVCHELERKWELHASEMSSVVLHCRSLVDGYESRIRDLERVVRDLLKRD